MMNSNLAAKKLLLETDFFTFARWNFKQAMKQSFIVNHHHKILADAFQRVLNGKTKKLLINIPPRYTKTEMVKQFCAAGFARNPASQFIYTSYSHKLALKCSKEIKDAIAHEKFQELWPVKIRHDTKAKELWETEDDGGIYATSFGGPITGFGAGKLDGYKSKTQWEFNGALIIDDPLKAQDRHRKIPRDECIDYFTGTLPSRFNSTSTPCICIMQRLHPDDLSGYIIENESDEWEIITLPAIQEDGTPLWEAKHNLDDLERLKRNNEMFSSQYMQQPILLGGNLIKPSNFKRYATLPLLRKRFITADTALKDKETSDFSCFQCWGVGYDNMLYLIDLLKLKLESKDLKPRLIDFWHKHLKMFNESHYGYLTCVYMEDKASGTQIIQEVQAEGKVPISAIQRSRSKLERVVDILLPKLEYVHVPEEEEWVSDFFTECEEFSADMSHKHDDQIDPLVDAVEIGSDDILVVDQNEIIVNNTGYKNNILEKTKLSRRAMRRRGK